MLKTLRWSKRPTAWVDVFNPSPKGRYAICLENFGRLDDMIEYLVDFMI